MASFKSDPTFLLCTLCKQVIYLTFHWVGIIPNTFTSSLRAREKKNVSCRLRTAGRRSCIVTHRDRNTETKETADGRLRAPQCARDRTAARSPVPPPATTRSEAVTFVLRRSGGEDPEGSEETRTSRRGANREWAVCVLFWGFAEDETNAVANVIWVPVVFM